MIELPTLSPLAAEAATLLAPRLPALIDLGGLRLCAALAGRDGLSVPEGWAPMQARIGEGSATLHLDPALLPRSVTQLWPEAQAVGVPEDLRSILRGVLLADLTELVQRRAGERPVWTEPDAAPHPHALALRRDTPEGALIAAVALDDPGLDWLARRMAVLPPHRTTLDELPMVLVLRLDSLAMTPAELAELETGDVVLLDREPFAEIGGLAVVAGIAGGPAWRAAVQAGQLAILSILDGTMDNPEEAEPLAFDELPMEVACEVGRITLPLAQLREIAVGQVLDLGMDATGSVSLRVNGHVVAVGELVRVADRVGIRLTEVRTLRR